MAKPKVIPNSALKAALLDAVKADEILPALARYEYRKAHPGADLPGDGPTVAEFLPVFNPSFGPGGGDAVQAWERGNEWCNAAHEDCIAAVGAEGLAKYRAGHEALQARLRERYPSPWGGVETPPEAFEEVCAGHWEQHHSLWVDAGKAKPDERIRHPLAEFMRQWLAEALTIEAETRADKRILPRIVAGDEPLAITVGSLFRGLHEGRRTTQPELPLWPGVPARKRVPILDVVDAAGVPVVQRGGAPLALRLFVRALSAVPPSSRGASVPLSVRVGDLLNALWPVSETTGRRTWRAGEHWPKLCAVLLEARDYAIHDGKGRWFPLSLRYLPDIPARDLTKRLDEWVILDVAFPEGATSGPPVALPVMDRLMVQSPARWRAFIASHCIAWAPGTTRVPVMRGPRNTGRLTWARAVSAYPVLTLDDMRRLAFGNDPHRSTLAKVKAAFRDLPGLVVLDETAHDERTGDVGFRVVPEAAAEAIRRKE